LIARLMKDSGSERPASSLQDIVPRQSDHQAHFILIRPAGGRCGEPFINPGRQVDENRTRFPLPSLILHAMNPFTLIVVAALSGLS